MNYDGCEFWKQVSPGLRRYLNLTPPTRDEAETELGTANKGSLSEEQIQAALYFAKAGRTRKHLRAKSIPDWLRNIDLSEVNRDMVLALARNAGVEDGEVEELLEVLREEALADEEREDENPT